MNLQKFIDSMADENLKLVPQSVVKHFIFEQSEKRNAIWDMYVTKNGRCFFALCAELAVSECVSLYEYDYKTNKVRLCFNLSEKVCQFKDAIVASKIHTSISEINDGRLIMTTHTTAKSPVHPYWLPEQYYNHTFEGYQGSNILIYDYNTGSLENRGIPVPHESIYGAAYDPKKNILYFTGFFRGHLYSYKLDSGEVRDYGKVTEFGSFRLHRGKDGNIYSASRSGNFYRVNTDTEEIEDLGLMFPKDYEPFSTNIHVQLDYLADGPDGYLYFKYIFGKNLYRYSYKDNSFEEVGDYLPDGLEIVHPYSAYGMVFDEKGVMWYTIGVCGVLDLNNAYLCRWDLLHGGKPENKGLVGSLKRSVTVPSEMHYYDGVIYIADSNHYADPPGIIAIDVRRLEKLNYSLSDGNLDFATDIVNYGYIKEPKRFYKYSEEEYNSQEKHNKEFEEYIAGYKSFISENTLAVTAEKVTAYPFWKTYGSDVSRVKNVWFNSKNVCAEFGNDNKKYRFNSADGSVREIKEYTKRTLCNGLPDNKALPSAAGRRFKAVATAATKIYDGKYLIGTADGILCIYDGESCFNLGACPNCSGEVRDICYCEKTRTAYGIIGSENDIGILFSFDEKNGVKYLGRMHFNTDTGLYCSSVLGCIAASEDGEEIAVGTDERMGVLYRIKL